MKIEILYFNLFIFTAVLPAGEDWQDGVLLPASFVFEHHYNTTSSAGVYVDILVTNDRAPHIKVNEF